MKFIIDLIEDIREEIGNSGEYLLTAGLLKEDTTDKSKLIYSGEALLNQVIVDDDTKQLNFKIDGSSKRVTIEELLASLLLLNMDSMMYELKIDVNKEYKDMEIVGFGKSDEDRHYILFIKI